MGMGKTENAENAMAQSALKRDTTLATGRLGPEGHLNSSAIWG